MSNFLLHRRFLKKSCGFTILLNLFVFLSILAPMTGHGQSNLTHGLSFDGANDRVTIPDNNALDFTSNYTLEAWVYPTEFKNAAGIIVKFQTTNGFILRLSGTTGKVDFDERVTTNNVLTLNAWNHIAAVNSGGTRTLYINGVSVPLGSSAFSFSANNDPVRLGVDFNDNNRSFKGKMDEVRIWNVVRTSAEISDGMSRMLQGDEAGLQAYYRFDQHTADGTNTGLTTLTNNATATGSTLNGALANFALTGTTSNWVSGYSPLRPLSLTTAASAIATTTATAGGDVTHTGGATVTARGSVWNTSTAPTISLSSKTSDGTGGGSFSSSLTGLTPYRKYFLRSYATNSAGTDYGNERAFTTLPPSGYSTLTNALDFDGTNDRVTIPDNASLDMTSNYTLEAWIYPTRFNDAAGLIDKFQSAGANGYMLRMHGTTGQLSFDERVTTSNVLTLNAWNHIAAVNSGGTRTLYVNGVSVALGSSSFTVSANNDPLCLGIDFNSTSRQFKGAMDEVRVWSVARTSTQINADKDRMLTGTEGGLVAYYRFDQGTADAANTGATTLTNISTSLGTAVNGTLVNFALSGTTSNWVVGNLFAPILTTSSVSDITTTTASSGGNVLNSGDVNITARGLVWGTASNPTVSLATKTTETPGEGTFTSSMTGLTSGTTYYVRAYATNGEGTAYGEEVSFTTLVVPPSISYASASVTLSSGSAITPISLNNIGGAPDKVQVSTLVGGIYGYENGVGRLARFNYPYSIAADGSGHLFVSDYYNHSIRKIVIATGEVSTLAGSVTPGYADGIGSAASFKRPSGVAVDGNGNLFVSDQYNHRIRKVIIATGEVTTLAGSGSYGTLDAIGTSASFFYPTGIALDGSGNLFVADMGSHRIRKIVISTGEVSTLAGNTQGYVDAAGNLASFYRPNGLSADGSGQLFVSDYGNHRIRKIDISTALVTTLAGSGSSAYADGLGTASSFYYPTGVAVDGIGNLFVADLINSRIRKVVTSTGGVTTLAGSGSIGSADATGTAASFSNPSGVVIDGSKNVYVAGGNNQSIRMIAGYRIDPALPDGLFFDARTGTISGTPTASQAAKVYTVYAQNAGGSTTTTITLGIAAAPTVTTSPAADVTGTTATLNATVRANGNPTTALNFTYSLNADLSSGTTISTTPASVDGNTITALSAAITGLSTSTTYYFRVSATNSVGTSNGTIVSFVTAAAAPNISYTGSPLTLSVGTAMTPIIPGNAGGAPEPRQVSTYAGTGSFNPLTNATALTSTFFAPSGVAVDAAGNVFVSDGNHRIRKIDGTSGLVSTHAGDGSTTVFYHPRDLAVDGSGNVYVTDFYNHRIRKVDAAGVVTTLAGTGVASATDGPGTQATFNNPTGITIDGSGFIYVGDRSNNRIRKITPSGEVSTLASNASSSSYFPFYYPSGLAVNASGEVFVANQFNHNILKVTSGGEVSSVAGARGSWGNSDGVGTDGKFYVPSDVAIDGSGNLYVADYSNHLIRKIGPTGLVSTLAGTGKSAFENGNGQSAAFSGPASIAIDLNGNLYVADYGNHRIRKISKYSISPALPAGLSFNSSTGEISGTPTSLRDATTYTVTTANQGGTSTTTFSLAVSSTLLTTNASAIGSTTATAGGSVDATNYAGATQKGVCWNTTGSPTIADAKTEEGPGTGTFTSTLTGLTPNNTLYYYRSYVTVGGVTSYGLEKRFSTNMAMSFPAMTKTYGDASFTLPGSSSMSTGAFSYTSGTTAVATVSGRTATITGAGSSVITVTQAAQGAYAATTATFTLTVEKAIPTLTLNIPANVMLKDANNLPITASSSHGEPVIVQIGSGTGTLTGTPGNYLLNGVSSTGFITFTYQTPATDNYNDANFMEVMAVDKNNQAITFNTLAPVTFANGLSVTLGATTSATGLSVSYTVTSGPGNITSGNTLNITGPGTIVIEADQAGNDNTNPAPTVTRTLLVNPAIPVITSFTPTSATEGDIVTITGQYFANVSAVSFGGTAATSFTVVSATQITAVVGTGHTGVVSVATTGGTDTEPGFRYKALWTGATNAFNSSGNWSGGRIPQTDDDIIFSSTAASDLELDGSKTVGHVNFNGSGRSLKLGAHNLTIKGNLSMPGNITGTGRVIMNGGAAQTITGGGDIPDLEIDNTNGVTIDAAGEELTVSGTLTSTSGTLTTNGKLRLKSNSSGTARVGQVTGSITGNVIAERFIKRDDYFDGTERAWRLVSVPVSGTGTLRDFFMNGRAGQDLTLTTNRDAETDNSGTPIVGHNYATASEATTAGFDWIGVANSVSSLRSYVGDGGGGSFASENVPNLSTTYASAAQGYMVFARGDRKLDFPSATSSGPTTFRSTGSLKTGTQTVSVAPASTSKFTLVGNPYMSVLNLAAFYTTNSAVINPSFWIWVASMAGTNNQGGYVNVYLSGGQWVTNTGMYIDPQLIESGVAFFVEPVSSLATATNINITEAHKSTASSAGMSPFATDQSDDHGRVYVRLERADARGRRQLIDGVMADFHSSFKTSLGDQSDREKLRNAISRGAMWLSTDKKILSSEGLPWPTEVKRSIPLYMSGVGDQTLIVRIDPRGMRDRYVQAWLKDNVLKRQIEINMSTPTDYDFIGTGSAAWDSTRFEIVYVEAGRPSTGLTLEPDDAAEQPSAKLYPNPSKSSDVKLSLRAMAPGAYSVHVLDMTGRLVATRSLDHRTVNGEYRILEGRILSPGKYIIRLSLGGTPIQTLQLIHE
jgi:sugar lactone lactonase YvrE